MTNNINGYVNITTNTTTQVWTGAATLVAIVVNTTSAGSIIIYDEAAAATTTTVGTLKASVAEGTYLYNVTCGKGIKIVTAGASDITCVFRTH